MLISQTWWGNIFPKILVQDSKFKELRHTFVNERAMIITTVTISLSLNNLCTFLLAKEKTWKRIFKTNSESSQNHTETLYAIQNKNKVAI